MTLSPRHEAVMLFVQRTLAQTGRGPTMEEIAKGCAIPGKSRAHVAVQDLCFKGYLARTRYESGQQVARGLVVLKPVPDDRFEEAAKAVCGALHKEPNPENIKSAREAIFAALVETAA